MRHRLEYLAVLTVMGVVRLLPRRASLALGSALGRVFYVLHGRRRELALENLRRAFPARSEEECRRILRGTFCHFGRHVVDLLNFNDMSTDEMMRHIELEGEDNVEQALLQGVARCSSPVTSDTGSSR